MDPYQSYPLVQLTTQNILDNIRFYQRHPFVRFIDKKGNCHEGHINCISGKDILIQKIGPLDIKQPASDTSWSANIPEYFSDQAEVFGSSISILASPEYAIYLK